MAKIIPFPKKKVHSNGFLNLIKLLETCDENKDSSVYLETAENLFVRGNITEGELQEIREIGKRKLEEPKDKISPGTYSYTPEMGEKKPEGCQMESRLSHYGNHYYVDAPLELKGRGITFLKKYEEGDFTSPGCYKVGWNHYRVTEKAYRNLENKYAISRESFLD